jgi:hypothetical protein
MRSLRVSLHPQNSARRDSGATVGIHRHCSRVRLVAKGQAQDTDLSRPSEFATARSFSWVARGSLGRTGMGAGHRR